jgi:uncharacterized protein YjbJ (UPF0337 family)
MKTATRQKWEGRWEQLAGKAKQLWGELTNDDIKQVQGNYEQLVGLIKERTGERLEEIERKLNA